MAKKLFDFAIGNPPYMDTTESDSTRMPPVYHIFMDAAYQAAEKTELITPARFLFNAGYTPKEWNEKMLNDPHFKVLSYETDASKIFPNTEIKGGVAITYHDSNMSYGAIGTFTKYPELNSILKKVKGVSSRFLNSIISSPLSFKVSPLMLKEHPNTVGRLRSSAFTNLAEIFYDKAPDDGLSYIVMIGLLHGKRVEKYVRRDYIVDSSGTLDKYTLLVAKANGAGHFGETLSSPVIAKPGVAYTQTFIAIGKFDNISEAENVQKYVKSKFARAMLGVLKITQDCPGPKWAYVPLQDFSSSSDINWDDTIAAIDRQLYRKYNLSVDEIAFIENNVKEME